MAHIAPDRVREYSTSTGTGNFTLTGAVTSFRAFSSVASVNDTFYYTIAALGLNEWEVGIGTYVSANTISRNTIIASSNAGSAVNFSTGDKDVFITAPGSKFLQMDNTGSYGNFTAGTITASLTGAASSNVLKSGDTMTGQLISTLANNTANGGGQIYLNGATGNRIDFNINGVAAPAATTRSAGTKIVLYPQISGTQVDYAFGIESSTLWSSVPDSTSQFKWYAATTNIATLSGLGVLTKRGQIFNYSYENGANQDYIRISGAANTTDYHAIGNYNTNELFIQPNTYARILRGYAYTASNRKQTPADTAILIDASNTFIAYDKGNVNIGHTTDQGYKLAVNGSFAATTKSFLIDHPTKPGKRLRYGSLEGPENGVYVRGRLTGKVIELPDYWTKLVDPDSITVQLTPIGKHQKLYVSDIKDNKVYIANDGIFAGEINCFYYVLAERCDVEKLEVEIG